MATELAAGFPSAPMVNSVGEVTDVWRAFFLALLVRTGGQAGAPTSSNLIGQINQETEARLAGDAALQADLTAETNARIAADSAEATARAAGDATNATAITTETGRATAAEATLFAAQPVAAITLPEMDGTASAGTVKTYSRGDHVHPVDTSRVAKSGDTMTGSLTIGTYAIIAGSGGPPSQLFLDNDVRGQRMIAGRAGGAARWTILPGDQTPGEDFVIGRYSDAGGWLDNPLTINRAIGGIAILKSLAVGGPFAANGTTPGAPAVITGSRGSATVAVLTQLLTALVGTGLIIDSTTA